jgi:predicted nucleic acid-binding protein
MRILLDTNVLIDFYTQRTPDNSARKFMVASIFGDIEVWASAKSFTDIFYIISKHADSSKVQDAFLESFEWLNICSVTGADLSSAAKQKWPDFEDCLVAECAAKIDAEYIVTRDKTGFRESATPPISPTDFFTTLTQNTGTEYYELKF